MIAQLKATLSISRCELLLFIRSRPFHFIGVVFPVCVSAALWIFIVTNGSTTSAGIDRWKYFQSELSRFADDVRGTYDFEKSDDRMLFYVVDHTNLNIDHAMQQEILRRDIARLINFLKTTPFEEWPWFENPDNGLSSSPKQLWAAVTSDNLTANELISTYSLGHDSTFSSRLATTDENHSWFVRGWNDNIEAISQAIPSMSFTRVVQVINTSTEWTKSAWVPAYIEIPSDFLVTRRANCFVADSWHSFIWAYPNTERRKPLQHWFEALLDTAEIDSSSVADHNNDDRSPRKTVAIRLELSGEDSLDDISNRHQRTQWLSSFMYTSIYLLSVVSVWSLLYFDPNLKPNTQQPRFEPSSQVMDGRVFGTMLKILLVCGIWFVLLFLPGWLLLGSEPAFGVGALAKFFHPLVLLNYVIFFVLGLFTNCYIFQILSLLRHPLQSFNVILITLNFVLIAANMSNPPFQSRGLVFSFMPLIGPGTMVKHTFGYPDTSTYVVIVLVAVLFLIGFRYFISKEVKLRFLKKELKYGYQPN